MRDYPQHNMKTKQSVPNTPKLPEEREWIEVLLEKVNFDPAELGSKWSLEDIIEFVSELLRNKDRELATFKAQVRKEIEELKSGQKIDYGHDCYEKWCDYCDANKRDEAITDCLSIPSLKEASNE